MTIDAIPYAFVADPANGKDAARLARSSASQRGSKGRERKAVGDDWQRAIPCTHRVASRRRRNGDRMVEVRIEKPRHRMLKCPNDERGGFGERVKGRHLRNMRGEPRRPVGQCRNGRLVHVDDVEGVFVE